MDLEQPRDREPLPSPGACRRPRSPGVEEEGLALWLELVSCIVSWTCFSKPVFHFIRFGHLKIQNSMPTSALRAFLVPRSSDPPGRSRSQGCARLRGRGPGGGARGALQGAGFGPGVLMLFTWNAAAGSPESAPCVGEVEGRSRRSLTTRCRPSHEGAAPPARLLVPQSSSQSRSSLLCWWRLESSGGP